MAFIRSKALLLPCGLHDFMSILKKLAGQTAIYGLSSIVGRLINFFLTPFYVRIFTEAENGIMYDLFALTAFIMIVFTYRLETAYFRYATEPAYREKSFTTALYSILSTSIVFFSAIIIFADDIAVMLRYPDHPEYIRLFGGILVLDALVEIPLARLRLEGKAMKYATIKLLNIFINFGLNFFVLYFLADAADGSGFAFLKPLADIFYNPEIRVGYVFIFNLLASASTFLLLLPYYRISLKEFDKKLLWKMLVYSLPLVVVSFAGIINEMLDRQLLKYILPYSNEENRAQLGIYGANYKLAMLLSLFTQAFRYAAEPFFFANAKDKKAPKLYALIAKYFTIVNLFGFLVIVLFLHYFKYYVGSEGSRFWEGLRVEPILLMANIFLGLYYNISTWFKVTDNTGYGMVISLAGAAITIGLNVWWIPIFGYMGSAWATLICYFSMTVITYILGMKYYPVKYDWLGIAAYMCFAVALYMIHNFVVEYFQLGHLQTSLLSIAFIGLFSGIIIKLEKKGYQESDVF